MELAELALVIISMAVAIVKSDYLQPVNQNGTAQFDLTTLKFVSVYSRHGMRSPLSTFPNDPCPFKNLSYWPNGVGRLTNTGKTQAYNLGKQLKTRYRGFISTHYYDNETVFQSNAIDRDLTSSQLMAAGMYPPVGFQIWNSDLLWQPIGVWVTDYDVDDTSRGCAKFEEEKKKVMDKLGDKFQKENSDFVKDVANLTGIELSQVHNELSAIWQAALIRPEDGCPNKIEWADTAFMNKLFPLAAQSFRSMLVGNEVMTRLIAGPLFETLIEVLNNKTRGTLEEDRKMSVLAGHDTTIVSLIGGLGIDELLIPDPASSLIFELHNGTTGNNVVQVLYFNHSTTAQPTLFEIPSCPHPCSLDDFTLVAQRMIVNSSREYCKTRQVLVSAANLSVEMSYPTNGAASFTSFLLFGSTFSTIIVIVFTHFR